MSEPAEHLLWLTSQQRERLAERLTDPALPPAIAERVALELQAALLRDQVSMTVSAPTRAAAGWPEDTVAVVLSGAELTALRRIDPELLEELTTRQGDALPARSPAASQPVPNG